MKEEGTLEPGILIERIEDYVKGKKWGYIFISSGDEKTLIEISEEGVELIADSSSRWEVELLLVQRGFLTETQLDKARRIAKETNKDLKPVINEQGFATTDQFEKASRQQAWEILLDVFLLEEGEYEFREEERRSEVDEELTPPFKFVFDHQEVLSEAKHRLSEYETQKTLIDPHERHNIKEENRPQPEDITEETRVNRIVEELEDAKSIREVYKSLNYSKYETYKTMTDLSMAGALQPMSEEEILEAAQEKLKEKEYKQAEQLYKLYLKDHPEELDIRQELARALAGSGKHKETAQLLVDTAKKHIDDHELQQAHQLLKKAYDHDPDNEAVREIWLDTVMDLNDPKSIRKTGGELIQSHIKAGNLEEASNVLDKLLDRFPHSIRLLMTGADLAAEQGDEEKVDQYIERSAEALPEDVAPDSYEAVQYLMKASSKSEKLEDKIKTLLGYHTPIFTMTNIGMFFGALIVGTGVFFLVQIQMQARSVYLKIDQEAQSDVRRGNLRQALNTYDKYLAEYPYSYKRFAAQTRKENIELRIQTRKKKKEKEKEKEKEREKKLEKDVIYTEEVKEIKTQFLSPKETTPYRKLEEKLVSLKEEEDYIEPEIQGVENVLERIRSKQKKARTLIEEVKKYTQDRDLKKAWDRIDQLKNRFARTEATEELFYPVKFTSLPPGVKLYIDNQSVGTTPLIYKFDSIRPYGITAVHQYYDKKKLQLSPSDDYTHTLVLEKRIDWEKDLSSAITAPPLLLDDQILAGTQEGLVWSGMYDRRERWRKTFKQNTPVKHLLSFNSNKQYVLLADGTLLSMNPSAQKTVHWKKEFSGEQILKPVVDPETNHLLLSSKANRIYVVDYEQGSVRSTISLPATPVSPVFPIDDGLFVLTAENMLYEIDLGKAEVKNGFRIGKTSERPLSGSWISSSGLLFMTEKNQIRGVDPGKQAVKTFLERESELFPTMALTDSSLFFATRDGTLFRWELNKGEKKWEGRIPDAPAAGPVSEGNMVYIADEGGRVHAFHGPSGELYWTKKIPFGIPTTGLQIHDKQMVFGTNEGFLYKINLGTYE